MRKPRLAMPRVPASCWRNSYARVASLARTARPGARLPMRKSSQTGGNQVLEEYCRHRGTQSKACQAKQQATQLHLRDHDTTALPQRRPSLVKREPCAEALAYQEWSGNPRPGPRICIGTLLSSDLLAPGAWGRPAVAITANWAVLHGYTFGLFTTQPRQSASDDDYCLQFSKVRAASQMLQGAFSSGAPACAWVLFLDADAMVNNLTATVEQQLLQPADRPSSSVHLVFACHTPEGSHSSAPECAGCSCGRAVHSCSSKTLAGEQPDGQPGTQRQLARSSRCTINSGAALIRNSVRGRDLVDWWAHAGHGAKGCQRLPGTAIGKSLGEQRCASDMKRRWPAEIDVVPAARFNSPAWYYPGVRWRPGNLSAPHKSKRTDRLYDTNGTLRSFNGSDQLRCFGSSQFMCHAYGLTANFSGFNPAGLGPHWKQILAQAYEARWRTVLPRLGELQGLRGTTPVSLEAITKVSRARAL